MDRLFYEQFGLEPAIGFFWLLVNAVGAAIVPGAVSGIIGNRSDAGLMKGLGCGGEVVAEGRSGGVAVCRGYGLNRDLEGRSECSIPSNSCFRILGRLAKFLFMKYTECIRLRSHFRHLCGQFVILRSQNRS